MLSSLASMINWRPISTVGVIGGLHSFLTGLGYLLVLPEFTRTLLYMSVDEIINPALFSLFLVLSGFICIWAFFKDNEVWIARSNGFQAFIWLFATCIYLLNGFVLLGLSSALLWSVIAGYISYVYKDRHNIAAHNAGW